MSIKKCPACSYTTDDESISICPQCDAELECENEVLPESDNADIEIADNEEIAEDTQSTQYSLAEDEEVSAKTIYQSTEENDDDDLSPNYTGSNYDESGDYDENSNTPAASSKKSGYITAITALSVLLLFAIVYILALNWSDKNAFKTKPANSETTITSEDDIPGVYTDGVIRYEFKLDPREVELADETEPLIAGSDTDADSDAEAAEKEKQIEKHSGTFTSAYTDEYIKKIIAYEYVVSDEALIDQIQSYFDDNGIMITSNDQIFDETFKYIEENGLYDAAKAYAAESGVEENIKSYSESGTWKVEDNKILLYVDGMQVYSLVKTNLGLIEGTTNIYKK